MVPALIVLAVLTALTAAICAYAYCKAYRRRPGDVTYKVLKGEDYDPYAERSLALIRAQAAVPFEEVNISSFDGIRLYGRRIRRNRSTFSSTATAGTDCAIFPAA